MAFAAAYARPSSWPTRPGAASLWSAPRLFPIHRWLAQRPTAPRLAAVSADSAACSAAGPSARAACGNRDAGTTVAARREQPSSLPLAAAVPPEWVVPPFFTGVARASLSSGWSPTSMLPHREQAGTLADVWAPAGSAGGTRRTPHPDRRAAHPSGGAAAGQRVAGEPPRLDLELRLLFSRYTLTPDEDFFTGLRIELGQRAWSLEHAIGAPRPNWSPAPGAESDLEKRRARWVTEVHLGLTMVETAPIRFPRPVRNALLARHAGQIGRCLRDLLTHPAAGSLAEESQRLLDALQRRR